MERSDRRNKVLFLDFDGVICDSVDECFVSSWLAYADYTGKRRTSVSLENYVKFKSYRPLIRRGADYLLLQFCIDRDITLREQADFDAQEAAIGDEGMDTFHRLFYAARGGLLESDRDYWLGLHRIYPGIYDALVSVADSAWILTTKEVSFVREILQFNDLRWPSEKLICSGKERKLEIINGVLRDGEEAVFVDDQIDHFSGCDNSRISCYLAAWGYVKPEWLQEDVHVLQMQDFSKVVLS